MKVTVEETEPGTRWTATAPTGATATARLSRLHTTHTWLEAEESVPSPTLRGLATALAVATGVPVAAKAKPRTTRHRWLTKAGATAYQIVPPSDIDCTDPDNLAWASRPVPTGLEITDLTGLSDDAVLDLWTDFYVWVHEGWSPVADRQAARKIFAPMMAEELDRSRSVLVVRDGRPSAHGFVFAEDDGWLVCCEAVAPDVPHGLEDVDTCLRAVVGVLARTGAQDLTVDGHVDDPHLYPVLQGVPHVTGAGLHLLHLG
ncbi:hypothetical protein [Ornithinimicrobium murale]|uniref:hypothetical protein n=1 Tax=Ornithinimicrobium murale TaxID=1050153 RepID=UPI000E0DC684|nr:hypothetical protein [Ornithinimicrobium murale]